MRIQSLIITLLAIVFLSSGTPAHAIADVSAVVSRMDVIIKQMEALKTEFAALVSSLNSTPAPTVLGSSQSSKPVFTMSLQNGQTNDDIKRIQKLLATDKEVYPYGVASGFYGPRTEEGIKNFQSRFGLDPVGVVGPATKSLLELFMNAYPNGDYPADVLKKKPQVQNAATSVPPASVPTVPVVNVAGIKSISANYDGEEAHVKVFFNDDTSRSFVAEGDTKISIVDVVASRLGSTRTDILKVIEFSSRSSRNNEDD